MKDNFNVRDKKGSIAIFVLVGLLFMSAFLMVSYGYNINKSKIAKEQFNIISDIYSYKDGDANAYERAYTALRKNNKQTLTKIVENLSVLELEKTYEENLVNYKIYGNGTSIAGYKMTISNLTNNGFLPLEGKYPTTNTTYPNATYEIIEIKKGQTFNLNYICSQSGNLRIRCIDSDTNQVVGDLVNDSGEIFTETEYYKTSIFYSYTKEENGYIIAKKDFKIGIMYIIKYNPEDFKLVIEDTKQTELPDGYQQVEYIESTGTQYIDTGYIPNSNTSIEIKASNSATSNTALYCARTTMDEKTYTAFLINGNNLRVDYNNIKYQNITIVNPDETYVYQQDKNKVYVDGKLVATLNEEEFLSEYNMYLMASHEAKKTATNIGKIKLYYCRIWDNGIIVRDFIPCYKNENGNSIPGLYDTIEGIFYTSESEEEFLYGKDVLRVGDLITDINDKNFGQYKIPIQLTDYKNESIKKHIILDMPLCEDEYIDFKFQKIIKANGTEEKKEIPAFSTYEDYTKIEILTNNEPAKLEVEYIGYTLEDNESEPKEYNQLEDEESIDIQYIDINNSYLN